MAYANVKNQFRLDNVELNRRIALVEEALREKERIGEALQDSEKRYRRLFESAKDGILILDADTGKVVDVNPFLSNLLGYPYDALCGQYLWELGVFKDIAASKEAFRTLQDNEYIRYDDLPLETFGGQPIAVEFVSNVYLVDHSKVIQCNIRDITERKRMEKDFKRSEERFRTVVESSPDAIFVRSGSGHLVYLNQAAVSLFGATSADQLIGQLVIERIHPDECAVIAERMKRLNEGHAVPTIEQIFLRMDGSPIPVEISAVPFQYEGTKGALVFARDISDRKNAEQALLESERGLRQLQKMEAMGTLAGGIAHDFNNILGAIIGYTELAMLDTGELPDVQSKLEQVHKAGLRAQDLVRQILTFSRQMDQELKPVVVSHLIKETIKMLRATIPSSIQIRHNIHPRTSAVMADPTQIHQVSMNLVTNATHAVQEVSDGSIEITLNDEALDQSFTALHPDLKPGNYVALKVKDNGAGIPPGIIERIFDPFFTTKETGKGTGMGLAVVHGIVKNLGGAITVESKVGAGATFTVYIPALEKDTARPEDSVEPIARGAGRILFVDDEEALAVIGQNMLERLGYKVDIRTSSFDALGAFRASPEKYDLVITDYTMHGMTGLALGEELLKIRPDIPIILCTGFSEGLTPEKARAAGIMELIMKPVVRQQLAQSVNKIFTTQARKKFKK